MAEEESKISRFPSGYKRQKAEGESPPLELTEEEKKAARAPEKPEPKKEFEKPFFRPTATEAPSSRLPLLIAVIAFIIALVSIGIAFMAYSDAQKMKLEAKGIMEDIQKIQSKPMQFRKTISTPVQITAEIPLSQILAGASIPITGTLPVSGSGKARSPTLGTFEVQIEATLPVNETLSIQQTAFTEQDKLVINSTTPLSIEVSITANADEFWGEQLDDIIDRLEKISR